MINVLEIDLNEEIGEPGIPIGPLIADIARLDDLQATGKTIKVRIDSPGGNVFDGVSLYNALANSTARVEVTIDGVAIGSAGLVAMAGDHITIHPSARITVAAPSAHVVGTIEDMQKMMDLLATIQENMAQIYARRNGWPVERWVNTMSGEEAWFGAVEALEIGLVDQITEDEAGE